MTTHNDYLYIYRFDGYAPRLHMSVYQPEVLWSGVLNGTPTLPATTLDVVYDTPYPPFGTVGLGKVPGYNCAQVIFRDPATGKRKGTTRILDSRALTYPYSDPPTVLRVRTVSQSDADLVDGDIFQIVAFYPLEVKSPVWQEQVSTYYTLAPDDRYQGYECVYPNPIICSGGHWAGWAVPTGNGALATHTNAGRTYNADPAGGTIGHEYLLTAGAVTITAPSGYDSSTFYISPGSNCVHHRSNHTNNTYVGKESNQNIYLMAHDVDHPPHEVILKDYSGDIEKGNNWTVEVTDGDVDEETCPDGAFCILWVDDKFNNGKTWSLRRDLNTSGRSHILGMGYLQRVTSEFKGEEGHERVTFIVQSPLQKLASSASNPLYFYEDTGSPPLSTFYSLWEPVLTLGFKRAILHTWQYWTTGMDAGFDFLVDDSFDDGRYPELTLTKSDSISQMRELANARRGIIVESGRGAGFTLQMHPALVELGSRP